MSGRSNGLEMARAKMADAGVDPVAIETFAHYYRLLEHGETGMIPESSIEPVDIESLADAEVPDDVAADAIGRTVAIKLNGGLGTSMGMERAKSLLCVRRGLSFLDIIARQALHLRKEYDARLPLIFMNSFRTSADTLHALGRYDELAVGDLPIEFLQNGAQPQRRQPQARRVAQGPRARVVPAPGHGDIYTALHATGLLDTLRDRGYRHPFLSNADNLGATFDARVPAWMPREGIPYVAEGSERTPNDNKGGHPPRRRSDGRLVLRDTAQVTPGEERRFADNEGPAPVLPRQQPLDRPPRHQEQARRERRRARPADQSATTRTSTRPTRTRPTPVIQIETAMGSAIEVFEEAQALIVPRDRFSPVKTTNELLLVRSDLYEIDTASREVALIDHEEPYIDLSSHYKVVHDFDKRFPQGAPSIRKATSLNVEGDGTFGRDIVAVADVTRRAESPRVIADGTRLEGDV